MWTASVIMGRTFLMPRFVLICALMTFGLTGPGLARQSLSSAPGTISGVVIDAVTGQPIAGAIVGLRREMRNPDPPLPPGFTTDSKGRFIFANLAAAEDYYLSARGFG